MLNLARKKDSIRAVKADKDNIEELKQLIGKKDKIELLNHLTNKYYKTDAEDGDYYVVTEIGVWRVILGHVHIQLGEYLVNSNDSLFKLTEEDLFKRYKVI